MKVWIDLDNTPHVPLFAPIAKRLESEGHTVLFTARDCFQVCGLADLLGVRYRRVGRHFGKNKFFKLAGLGARALQLLPTAFREKPDLAISHGSRAQLLLATALGIPTVLMMDYEFVRGLVLMSPSWILVPELMPDSALHFHPDRILRYPGIKEDVYAPGFRPDPSIQQELGLDSAHTTVVLRPPAQQAHYHVPESDDVFSAVMEFLEARADVRVVLLPRNQEQCKSIQGQWPKMFRDGRMVIPARAVDGLNLIWHSDLVISGGGTMNREAAALGVPVYSTFRGKIGAVDSYLSTTGRLTLVESAAEVPGKIRVERRARACRAAEFSSPALNAIVQHIVHIAEAKCPVPQFSVR